VKKTPKRHPVPEHSKISEICTTFETSDKVCFYSYHTDWQF